MNSIISISIAALLSSAALSLSGEKDGHQTAEQLTIADPMLEGYAVIAEALFKGDLGGAKKAASRMVENDRKNVMSISARALSRSRDLSEARIHFRMLSLAAAPSAKKEKALHAAHCPMAMHGWGADWFQKSKNEIRNPYMGKKMPHCGEFSE
jgi:hypothetical protein